MCEQRFDHICAEHAEAMEAIEQRVREVLARRQRTDAPPRRERAVARMLPPHARAGRQDDPEPAGAVTGPGSVPAAAATPVAAAGPSRGGDPDDDPAPEPPESEQWEPESPEPGRPDGPRADAGDAAAGADADAGAGADAGPYHRVARCGPVATGAALLDPRWNSHLPPRR